MHGISSSHDTPIQALVITFVRIARNYSQHARTNFASSSISSAPQEPSQESRHTRSETHVAPVRSDTFESPSRRRAPKQLIRGISSRFLAAVGSSVPLEQADLLRRRINDFPHMKALLASAPSTHLPIHFAPQPET
jgi:hypothetical protein